MHPLMIAGVVVGGIAATIAAIATKKKTTVDPARPADMDAQLLRFVDELDIANVGTPQHKVPSAATISGAMLYADQIDRAGYHNTAVGLRESVKMSTGT